MLEAPNSIKNIPGIGNCCKDQNKKNDKNNKTEGDLNKLRKALLQKAQCKLMEKH